MSVDMSGELVLAGPFGIDDVERVSTSCRQLALDGAPRVILDVAAVTRCDADGLNCWLDLAGGSGGTTVLVVGARWSQFLELLRHTPVARLPGVSEQIRRVLASDHHPSTPPAGGTS